MKRIRICSQCGSEFRWEPDSRGGRPRTRCYECRPSDSAEPLSPPPWERSRIVFALSFCGPFGDPDFYPWSDEELERHWREWARDAEPWDTDTWDKTTWAYWRFRRGLSAEETADRASDEWEQRHRRKR
jgi:hypothetical protein